MKAPNEARAQKWSHEETTITNFLRLSAVRSSDLRQDEGNNETVQSQRLGENENENHRDEKTRLLTVCSHSRVSDNSNGHSCSKTAKSARQSRGQSGESVVSSVVLLLHCCCCCCSGKFVSFRTSGGKERTCTQ